MMISLFGYTALLLLTSAAALFALDRVIKIGSRGGDADVSLNGIFYTGLTLTLVFVTVTVIAFTGAFALLGWFLLALAAALGAAFAWRVRRAAAERELMAELIAEEERVVRETARRDPGNAAAWTRLAELSDRKGDRRRAEEYMRKACELEPTPLNSAKLKSFARNAALFLLLLPAAGFCAGQDYRRDRHIFFYLVNEELAKALLSLPGGPGLAGELKAAGASLPRFDMEDFGKSRSIARFVPRLEIIVFNRERVLSRLGLKTAPDQDIPWSKLVGDRRGIAALARSLAPTYFHELVHLRQQRAGGAQVFPENEYEAFILTDNCVHAMVKKDPSLLAPYAKAGGYNGYTPPGGNDAFLAEKVEGYFQVCGGKTAYFDNLSAAYAHKLPQDGDDYGLPLADPAKMAFLNSVNRLVAAWPAFWAEAALTIGRAAARGGNYPLALTCLVPPQAELKGYGLPEAALKEISGEALAALAAAGAAVRTGENGNFDLAAQDFLALEQAYRRLGRPLPADLAGLRGGIYARGREFYAARLAAEKDPARRAYYEDSLAAFSPGAKR